MNIETNDEVKKAIALEGLYQVMDPEVDLNIVDLGLVYKIEFDEEKKENVVLMTLTTRFCPMGESIVAATTQSMEQSFPGHTTKVNLTFNPPWEVSMISEEGNKFLNL
ncbi:MAG TPA: metal-sulfur cluster assembly factor [Aequorivita sp.]|nr:metal-sulfur cluster assembly factor [Aequorivita sp.]